MKKILVAVLSVLAIVLACSPEEVGVQVDTAGGKLGRIARIPEMTRQDFTVMKFIGEARSVRDLEPQMFRKNRWEIITQAGEKLRMIVNEKDADEVIDILAYQVIVTDSNTGIATAINREGLLDDTIGRVIVDRSYMTPEGLYGIKVFAAVNHPGRTVIAYLNCREVSLRENTVAIVHENIDPEAALNKHRRWVMERMEASRHPSRVGAPVPR